MKRIIVALFALSACGSAISGPTTEPLPPIELLELSTTSPTTTTVVPPTTLAPVPVTVQLSYEQTVELARATWGKCGEWRDLALSVGWPESEWPRLGQVLYRESRCTPSAWNGHDAGLSQINQVHTSWANEMGFDFPNDLFIPENNLYFAYRLWSAREEKGLCGWKPWSFKCVN
jgi:hypothetical protein